MYVWPHYFPSPSHTLQVTEMCLWPCMFPTPITRSTGTRSTSTIITITRNTPHPPLSNPTMMVWTLVGVCMCTYNIHKVMKGYFFHFVRKYLVAVIVRITNLHTVIVWSFCTMDNLKYDRQSFSSLSFPVQLLHRFLGGKLCTHKLVVLLSWKVHLSIVCS